MLCYAVLWFVMLTYFMSKISCSKWVKSYALLCCVMICYADLFNAQNLIRPYQIDHWHLILRFTDINNPYSQEGPPLTFISLKAPTSWTREIVTRGLGLIEYVKKECTSFFCHLNYTNLAFFISFINPANLKVLEDCPPLGFINL